MDILNLVHVYLITLDHNVTLRVTVVIIWLVIAFDIAVWVKGTPVMMYSGAVNLNVKVCLSVISSMIWDLNSVIFCIYPPLVKRKKTYSQVSMLFPLSLFNVQFLINPLLLTTPLTCIP